MNRPVPTKLKILRGNPGKRPINQLEPKLHEITKPPAAPAFLGDTARGEWRRRAREFVEIRMLTSADLGLLAAYCESYGRFADASKEFNELGAPYYYETVHGGKAKHPLVGIIDTAEQSMLRNGSEFGLTPSSRSRLKISPQKPHVDPNDPLLSVPIRQPRG
jgi:P27 family predicted phage terminase small subunit